MQTGIQSIVTCIDVMCHHGELAANLPLTRTFYILAATGHGGSLCTSSSAASTLSCVWSLAGAPCDILSKAGTCMHRTNTRSHSSSVQRALLRSRLCNAASFSVHAFCARGVTEASVSTEESVVEERGGLVLLTQAALENTGPSLHLNCLPLRCARNAGCQVQCSSLAEVV